VSPSPLVSGLFPGPFVFGAAPIAGLYAPVSEEAAAGTLAAAWAVGIRAFDTAPHYGVGVSERRLGTFLAGRPRDEFTVCTKVGRLLVPAAGDVQGDEGFYGIPPLTRVRDYSRDGVRRSLEESLERLGLDRVDVVYVHDPDDHLDQAVSEAVPALVALRDEGVVGAVGVGMNGWAGPARLVRETDLDVVMLAGRWTLLDRSGAPLLDLCRDRGVSVVAAAPYNSGLLARPRPAADAHFDYAEVDPVTLARAHELADRCEAGGSRLPSAALQFALRRAEVSSVVVGLRTPQQVTETVQRCSQEIDEQTWRSLDA
jgi:D-threo-aldose 1-dehydrogenase